MCASCRWERSWGSHAPTSSATVNCAEHHLVLSLTYYSHCSSCGRTISNTIFFLLKPPSQSKAHERPTWKTKLEDIVLKDGWEKVQSWEALQFLRKTSLFFLSVYVDNFKMFGQKGKLGFDVENMTKTHRLGWSYSFVEPPKLWNLKPTVSDEPENRKKTFACQKVTSWSCDMMGHAEMCANTCCELAEKDVSHPKHVGTLCTDDHRMAPEFV